MMQQFSGGKSAPHLTQYKNDMSAKQKLIRQRLGGPSTEDNSQVSGRERITTDKENQNIPSIDDEAVEQISTQERRFKSRFSYHQDDDDDEAEASLQFFKRNLLPDHTDHINSTAPSSSNWRTSTTSNKPNNQEPIRRSHQAERGERTRPAPLPLVDKFKEPKEFTAMDARYQIGAGKPVPFKQTSFFESRLEQDSSPVDELSPPPRTREPPSEQRARYGHSLGRASVERPPVNNQVAHLRASSAERAHRAGKTKSSERLNNETSVVDNQLDEHKVDDKRLTTDSPSQTGSFTRKPLYNSLLRAHDSIRLKVNRPKIRSKSQDVAVNDAEIDDSIQLAEIDNSPSDEPQERAVDVRRGSSRRKSKKKDSSKTTGTSGEKLDQDSSDKIPVRNFSEVRVVRIKRNETERSIGVTVRADEGNIVVARIMSGSLADKQGALQVGDFILSVNGREVYTPEQLQEQLRRSINVDDDVIMKIVPSFREELPTLCIYLRALFTYDPNEDSLLPCKEVGVSFNQGDILEVVNQEDPNWWQARRVDSENLQTGLIPSQELEERRRAFVIPDYDLSTRTSICGTKVSRKSKKKEIYNVGQNSDFDRAELQLYEEVCRTPAFERRTLVLIGANGVGKQAIKNRLIALDPDRFGTPLPHTSRLAREGEEDGVHYHFVTRERMEEDIIEGKYLEFGEYDGALYGTKLDSVREIIGSGKVCVLDCSATCLKILKTSDYLPFVAFIAAPTLDQLRYMHDWARNGNNSRNYTTLDRALSRQSRRARTLQDFAFDFFEDEDLQVTVEESARLFRVYENYFDIVLVNNNFERTFEQLKDAIDALSMAPQWIPISWIYGT